MIHRIEEIKGIGLLHDANGRPHGLQKATLIYADNGRGKSTLSSILRSAQLSDPTIINERKTIDGTLDPNVILQFGSGHRVIYSGGAWSEKRPELLVFDADFIEKNVHSGGTVSPGHRKNLLEFALGEPAVAARVAEEQATQRANAANERVKTSQSNLLGFHQGMTLTDFEGLAAAQDVDAQIQAIEKRLVAARNSALLLQRRIPNQVNAPRIDLQAFFDVLGKTLDDIQSDAEQLVRVQVQALGGKNAEAWLSQGQQFESGDSCPYCTQSTEGIDLISAYRSYFNAEYTALKKKVIDLEEMIRRELGDAVLNGFDQRCNAESEVGAAWMDQLEVPRRSFDLDKAKALWSELRSLLQALVERKKSNPVVSVGTAQEQARAIELWTELLELFASVNTGLRNAREAIEEFTKKLASEDVQALQRQQRMLTLAKVRHQPQVLQMMVELTNARTELATAIAAKQTAREALDALMSATLSAYQVSINDLLTKFGATFQIERMDANFRGGSPRAEYGLSLRGRSVQLDGGNPSFATALSEGDKRTLAFAFFVASTLSDPSLANRIVVVDDPMSSLDANRKHHTKKALSELCTRSAQLIVLAHDIYFIRDLRDELGSRGGHPTVVFGLTYAANGYTDFARLDIDLECRSPYYHHHSLLSEYVASGAGSPREVAKAIRPLLEGYLHRRFPGLIPNGLMFGGVVLHIGNAVPPSPLCFASGLVQELNEINSYAGRFHHDTKQLQGAASSAGHRR